MTETRMTAEKALALRKPFPPESIGKLPKGGQMLDYCGHAAVTDRLLAVDPLWSWEPLALDAIGLPAIDSSRNLWIRLTICGVTRIGVGDGKSAKECIGDAIRNAAMRFGVALDLWAKEDLVEFAQSITHDNTPPPKIEQPKDSITDAQQRKMRALLGECGLKDRAEILEFASQEAGRTVASSTELTKAEAGKVIDALEKVSPKTGEVK